MTTTKEIIRKLEHEKEQLLIDNINLRIQLTEIQVNEMNKKEDNRRQISSIAIQTYFIDRVFNLFHLVTFNEDDDNEKNELYITGTKFISNYIMRNDTLDEELNIVMIARNTHESLIRKFVYQLMCAYPKDGGNKHPCGYIIAPTVIEPIKDRGINTWKIEGLIIDQLIKVNIIIYEELYENLILYSHENIAITRSGYKPLIHAMKDREITFLSYNSMYAESFIKSIISIQSKETYLLNSITDSTKNKNYIKAIIDKQNQIIAKDEYTIIGGIMQGLSNEDKDEDKDCSICYDDDSSPLYKLVCGHVYCTDCIFTHMDQKNLLHNYDCPMCRKPIQFIVKDISRKEDLLFSDELFHTVVRGKHGN